MHALFSEWASALALAFCLKACSDVLCWCCSEYADFRVSSDGEVQGVGLLIASDPSNGKLVVLAPITGGPADRAGIKPGDEVSINGVEMLLDPHACFC